MFNKILVANRGEIALRVIRTAKEMGIETVAIYSDSDRYSLHAKHADESYHLGVDEPSQSYLNIDRIIDIALKSKSEAIHPGYGFLAENSAFAEACESTHLAFIGPRSDVLKAMGEKLGARKLMEDSGISITPGITTSVSDDAKAEEFAESIGYPIILKASGGGGGIGMTVVRKKDELAKCIKTAQSVSLSSFGNDEVYMEKFVEAARHIEFQILADSKGNTVHLGERECSIQRRYQKLIEEAPSVALTKELRERMGDEAVRAAKAANYNNAGTVEFLFSNGEFYFNEVNARLQVEHPVTELVTGKDLVAEQLKIAAGEELDFDQKDIEMKGWAFECRINAENPYKKFMPSPGLITGYTVPGGFRIRVDSGVYEGFNVPSAYDPLIAKLITSGKDRTEAMTKMRRALAEFQIMGIKTNIPFHTEVLEDEEFALGNISTEFIKKRGIVEKLEAAGVEISEEELKKAAALSAWLTSYPLELEKLRRARVKRIEVDKKEREKPPGLSKWTRAGREELHGRSRFHEV